MATSTPPSGLKLFGQKFKEIRTAWNQRSDTGRNTQAALAAGLGKDRNFIKRIEMGKKGNLTRAECNSLERTMGVARDEIWKLQIECVVDPEIRRYLATPPNWKLPPDVADKEAQLLILVRMLEVSLQASPARTAEMDDAGWSVAGALAHLLEAAVQPDADTVRTADLGHGLAPGRAFGNIVALLHELPKEAAQRALFALESALWVGDAARRHQA